MRLFTAIVPPVDVVEKIVPDFDKFSDFCKFKAVEKENMHITLHFLGDVEENKSLDVIKCVESLNAESFNFSFNRVSFFKRDGLPSVFFAAGSSAAMKNIYDEMGACFKKSGLKTDDRPFKAHMTFFRIKEVYDFDGLMNHMQYLGKNFETTEFVVDMVKLIESRLSGFKPVYKIVKEKKFI